MRVLAVDLGATSVRVAAVDLDAETPQVDVLHRWPNAPVVADDGTLRWDWDTLTTAVEEGLQTGLRSGPVAAIGVDGWGVDYGLIDAEGALVAAPFSYRDRRTAGWLTTAEAIGRERLYDVTGVQLMGINSIFQLAVHEPGEMARAARLMLLPDLMVNALTGYVGAERSNASTTGLLDARTGNWSHELAVAIDLDPALLPTVYPAGQAAGSWRGVPVHLVGSHDTASAFLAAPAGAAEGTIFVSTGTWVIVGVQRPSADTSAAANAANFSNEAGAFGGFRFLKNVMGFWMLEQCRTAWGEPAIATLLAEAEAVDGSWTFDARDDRFLAPDDMEHEIRTAAHIPSTADRGVVVRSIIDSIAASIVGIVDEIVDVTGISPRRLSLVGGGARIGLLKSALELRTGLEVLAGSPEATALGNAVAQGIAIGRFEGSVHAAAWVSGSGAQHID